jgi:hypothetical protein
VLVEVTITPDTCPGPPGIDAMAASIAGFGQIGASASACASAISRAAAAC